MRLSATAVVAGAASGAVAAAIGGDSPVKRDTTAVEGGNYWNDSPANIDYLSTTQTFTVPAETGTDPAYDDTPATTWTIPSQTFTIIVTPSASLAQSSSPAGRRDEPGLASLYRIMDRKASLESVLSSAEASAADFSSSAADLTATITAAPSDSTLQARDVPALTSIFSVIDLELGIIMSAKSALAEAQYSAAYYSGLLNMGDTSTVVDTACATYGGEASCTTESLFFAQDTPTPNYPKVRAASSAQTTEPASTITAAPSLEQRQDAQSPVSSIFSVIDGLLYTIMSAKSALAEAEYSAAYYSGLLAPGDTSTVEDTACVTVGGQASCTTESFFFAQGGPTAREALATSPSLPVPAQATVPTVQVTGAPAPSIEKRNTITVTTKTVTTEQTISEPDTTFVTSFTTLDTCTEYIGGEAIEKRGCFWKRQWPSIVTTTAVRSNDHTTVTQTVTCRALDGSCIDVHSLPPRTAEEPQVVTASVAIATETKYITASTGVTSQAAKVTGQSAPYANSTTDTCTTSALSSILSPINGTHNSTTTSTALVDATTASGMMASSTGVQSSGSAVPPSTSEADGGKQLVGMTVGMVFFAVLAFCL